MKTKAKKGKAVPVTSVTKHKQSLSKLQEKDPDFYEFLQKEDSELLQFASDSDAGSESGENDDSESEVDSEEDLESSSEGAEEEVENESSNDEDTDDDDEGDDDDDDDDEDDDEDDDDSNEDEEGEEALSRVETKHLREATTVTSAMIKQWTRALREDHSIEALTQLVSAFQAGVQHIGGERAGESPYKVEDTLVFNTVVQGCITCVYPTLSHVLQLTSAPSSADPVKLPPLPAKRPRWKKVQGVVRSYLGDLITLQSELSEASVLDAVLKHTLVMVPFFACFPKLTRTLIKRLVKVWSSDDASSRVVAFLALNKLVRMTQDAMLEPSLKQMYLAYVSNCKFTSPSTLPLIRFLQRSLVEMYSMDLHATYQYAFVYVRQLAIHLRNAITVKKEENLQAVYNWQFIHSLSLWTQLLCSLHPSPVLQPLIYPLTQVIIGTIKLQPTGRYLPLRFHCIRMLNMLSEATQTYIPILPFLIEVFDIVNFNKKHQAVSFKPFNFACLLKFSKGQLRERAFKDGVMENLTEHMLDHLHIHAHTLAFPELVLPSQIQLKRILKACKVANYSKQLKVIVDKVEETSKVISLRRRSANLGLADSKAVNAWESRSAEQGTPLGKYYTSWRKLRDAELRKQAASAAASDTTAKDQDEGESGSSDEEPEKPGSKRKLKESEHKSKKADEYLGGDGDFTAEELAVLAGTGGENSDSDTEEEEEEKPKRKKQKQTPVKSKDATLKTAKKGQGKESSSLKKPTGKGKKKGSQEGEDMEEPDIVQDFTFSSDED